jgi:hypothetical protein
MASWTNNIKLSLKLESDDMTDLKFERLANFVPMQAYFCAIDNSIVETFNVERVPIITT